MCHLPKIYSLPTNLLLTPVGKRTYAPWSFKIIKRLGEENTFHICKEKNRKHHGSVNLLQRRWSTTKSTTTCCVWYTYIFFRINTLIFLLSRKQHTIAKKHFTNACKIYTKDKPKTISYLLTWKVEIRFGRKRFILLGEMHEHALLVIYN